MSGEQAVEGAAGGDAKGIPKFWCTVLMRCDITRDIMNEKDPAVLEYLTDIQVGGGKGEIAGVGAKEGWGLGGEAIGGRVGIRGWFDREEGVEKERVSSGREGVSSEWEGVGGELWMPPSWGR